MSRSPRVRAVLVDLLMATMDSIRTWADAAGDRDVGLAWRDGVTERMVRSGGYRPYRDLVAEAAGDLDLDGDAPDRLEAAWQVMHAWPDAGALHALSVPYAFVTNCSTRLAGVAAGRSGLEPAFTLSAEDAGWYKPRPEIYLLACERIGTPPRESLFVAGAAYDAEGASRAGLRARLIPRRAPTGAPSDEIAVVPSMAAALGDVG